MADKLYKLKPLEWQGGKDADGYESWFASTPFGEYRVTDFERIHWGYCFDEYYDEDEFDADSIEEAKAAADKHWQERLSPMLEEQPNG